MLVNVELPVQFVHSPSIKEDQYNEYVNRSLLGKPEPQSETADANRVELVNQQNAESVRTNKPDDHAAKKQLQIGFPIHSSVFGRHRSPSALVNCCWQSTCQSIMHYREKGGPDLAPFSVL